MFVGAEAAKSKRVDPGHGSTEAMDVADVLTASFQRSVSTLEETIEAMVVVGGGSISVPPLATAA